jgi:hypothetical protein
MNKLDRRQQLEQAVQQDPNMNSTEIVELMQQDTEFNCFVLALRKQQLQLEQALRITPPPELSAELLKLPQQIKPRHNWLKNVALVASVAVISLVSLMLYIQYNQEDMASHVLAHVHQEALYVDSHLVQQPLADVNAKLASFNLSLNDWSEEIIYARFCTFKGIRSLHLAVRTGTGYATVFIVPKDSKLDLIAHFSDPDYQGLSLAMAQANLVVISREVADLSTLPTKLVANLRSRA